MSSVAVKPAPDSGDGRGAAIGGFWGRSRSFITEVRNEMRRVTWPSRREVYATTVVVILTSAFFGLYLWGLDLAIDKAIRGIFALFGAR